MRYPIRLSVCLAAIFALSVRAESVSPKPSVGVAVSDIFDNRGTMSSTAGCRVFLTLSGDAVADAHGVRRVRVTNARDELGRDLVKPDNETGGGLLESVVPILNPAQEQQRLEAVAGEVARRRAMREAAQRQLSSMAVPTPIPTAAATPVPTPLRSAAVRAVSGGKPSVNLRNPSRQSATIKIIEGEIELFTPTETNGGIVRLSEPLAKPAAFLANDALKASAVQLMYLSIETYAQDREAAGRDARDATGPWSEEVATMIKAFVSLPSDSRRQTIIFFIHDPNRVVVDLDLQTQDGKPLERGSMRLSLTQLRGIALTAPPPADAQLVVRIAVPSAITTHPFKLENIPLP